MNTSKATKTTEQVLADQDAQAARARLTSTSSFLQRLGGSDDDDDRGPGGFIKCIECRWLNAAGEELPTHPVICIGTTREVQHWQGGLPVETITTRPLPNVKTLNDNIPVSEWEEGLDGKPRAPWAKMYVALFICINTAAIYRFSNSTWGARFAVRDIESRIAVMRALRGADVVPVVKLASKTMPTRYGPRLRPHFEIVEWRHFGTTGALRLSGPEESKLAAVKPVSASEELNDELPW
jgi:hypothetical protein